MSYENKTPRAKRERGPIINFQRFSMWTPIEGGRRAQLVFGIQDGNPRFTVFYPKKDASELRTPSVTAAMGLDTCIMLLKAMESFTKKTDNRGTEIKVENTRNTFENGSSTPTGKTISTITIFGRDDEGRYYLQIKDMIYPKQDVKFYFDKSDWHNFLVTTAEGIKPLGRASASQVMAEGMIEALRIAFVNANVPDASGVSAGTPSDTEIIASAPKPVPVVPAKEFEDLAY